MTQAELVRALNVSQQAMFAYEWGDRRVSVLILVKLARIFGTSVEDAMWLEDADPAESSLVSCRCAAR